MWESRSLEGQHFFWEGGVAGRFHKVDGNELQLLQKFQVQMNFPGDIASTKLGNHHIYPIKNTYLYPMEIPGS